ncbi:hypothetical protein GCM10009682_17530 [Luedemannella flava]|uniref:Uncharacterized protein n=1 Tax=Luedemannella flava TaxID=349316 RepID=A0ABN2LQ21_9ACTN
MPIRMLLVMLSAGPWAPADRLDASRLRLPVWATAEVLVMVVGLAIGAQLWCVPSSKSEYTTAVPAAAGAAPMRHPVAPATVASATAAARLLARCVKLLTFA